MKSTLALGLAGLLAACGDKGESRPVSEVPPSDHARPALNEMVAGLAWAATASGPVADAITDIAVTDEGVYTVELLRSYVTPTILAPYAVRLSKRSPEGDELWAHSLPAGRYTTAPHVAASYEAVYVGGNFDTDADFDDGPDQDEKAAGDAGRDYLSAFGSGGDYRFTQTFEPTFDSGELLVAADGDDVYVYGELKLDGGLVGGLAQLDSSGNVVGTVPWDFGFSSLAARDGRVAAASDTGLALIDMPSSQTASVFWKNAPNAFRIQGLAFDASGALYVAGTFRPFDGPVDLDPGDGVELVDSVGLEDTVLIKLDAGGGYQWSRAFGGPGTDRASDVAVDSNGSLLMTGTFKREVDWGVTDADAQWTAAGADAFAVRVDSEGTVQGVYAFGTNDEDAGPAVAVSPDGGVFLAGTFTGSLNLAPECARRPLESEGKTVGYVAKLTPGVPAPSVGCPETEPPAPQRNQTDPRLAGTSLPQNFDECVAAGGGVSRAQTGYDQCGLTLLVGSPGFAECLALGGVEGWLNEKTPQYRHICVLMYAEYGPLCLSGHCP